MVSVVFGEPYTQRSVSGSLSESRVLTCSLRQATILGPLLFLWYKMFVTVCEPRKYVGDTYLIYANNNVGSIESCPTEIY